MKNKHKESLFKNIYIYIYSGSKNCPYSMRISLLCVGYVWMRDLGKFLFSAACSASALVYTQQFSGLNSLASSFSEWKEMARNCCDVQKLSIQLHFSIRTFPSRNSNELDHTPFDRENCREYAGLRKWSDWWRNYTKNFDIRQA